MAALLPTILTASLVLAATDGPPKFNVERTCRPASAVGVLPGRDSSACQNDENAALTKLRQDWTQYSIAQRNQCAGFAGLDRAPSYVELLTCLEMAKQSNELPADSKAGTVGQQ
jgi:hypothetical protein